MVCGLHKKPSKVVIATGASSSERTLGFTYDTRVGAMTIRKPEVGVVDNFDLRLDGMRTE